MMMKKCALFFLVACAFAMTGCSHNSLYLRSDYVDHDSLASVYAGTPDSLKENPYVGQRLIANWSLSRAQASKSNLRLQIDIRYGSKEQESFVLPIEGSEGSYVYKILNDDYFNKKGFLTYRGIILASDGEVVAEWKHQIWTDVLLLDEEL
jgi:hypothetical protein